MVLESRGFGVLGFRVYGSLWFWGSGFGVQGDSQVPTNPRDDMWEFPKNSGTLI